MRILFKYLTGGLLKMPPGTAASAEFVTGPETLGEADPPVNAPQLHVSSPRGEPREAPVDVRRRVGRRCNCSRRLNSCL